MLVSHTDDAKKKISEASLALWSKPEHRANMAVKMKGRKPSAATLRGITERRKTLRPWENSRAIKDRWLLADIMYDIFHSPDYNVNMITVSTGFYSKQTEAIRRQLAKGWNPRNDPDWLKFKQTNKET